MTSAARARRTAFLTAEWRYLVMLNYEISPVVLQPLVPTGTTLDLWNGRALVSVVGFRFLRTRVLGAPIPFHRHFDEVNLRFYVRRVARSGELRHGVVFVRELVPRAAIAIIARARCNEPYLAVPMRSTAPVSQTDAPGRITYEWRTRGVWQHVSATAIGAPAIPPPDSQAAFIAEHYWGYTRQRNGGTVEYEAVAKRHARELGLSFQDIDDVLDYLCSVARHRQIFYLWRPVLPDPRDDLVLELAVEAGAECIVTHNLRDFGEATRFGVQPITPRDFLRRLRSGS